MTDNCKELPEVFTYETAAEYLNVSERTVWGLVKAGKIKASKIGRQVRITYEAIRDFLKRSEISED